MTKEEFLAALTAEKPLVIYWNDTTRCWVFYEMGSFISDVLYSQYRKLGKELVRIQTQRSHTKAREIMEERIRLIREGIEQARRKTGIAFLQVEGVREIFGYYLVVPVDRDWARNAAVTNLPAANIHVHRELPNIRHIPSADEN